MKILIIDATRGVGLQDLQQALEIDLIVTSSKKRGVRPSFFTYSKMYED
jgi:hypothetical protein